MTRKFPIQGKALSRDKLEQYIVDFMKAHGTCVLATCSDNKPRASTVELFPLGATLYILTEGGRKIENIRKNPRVSVAMAKQYTGLENLKGLQIDCIAEIGEVGSQVFMEGVEAYRLRRKLKSALIPDFMLVIKIIPKKMEYLDTSLSKKGFSVRQVLEYL